MPYGMASHGPWCVIGIWEMVHRPCRQLVYYYTCTHGSKVFFDEKGGDWEKHDCTQAIISRVWLDIDREYARRLERRNRPREWQAPIQRRTPENGLPAEDLGVVREIHDVDVYRHFHVESERGLAHAFLGPLAPNDFVQVTVHAALNATPRQSYTFLIRREGWRAIGAGVGDLIAFKLEGHSIPGKSAYWLCDPAAVGLVEPE